MNNISGITGTGTSAAQQAASASSQTDPQLFAQMLKARLDADLLSAGLDGSSSGLGTGGIMDIMLAQALIQNTQRTSAMQDASGAEQASGVQETPAPQATSVRTHGGLRISRVYTPEIPITGRWPQHAALNQNAALSALTRIGDPYSQSRRGTGRYVDCSYLTQWAYGQNGLTLPATAAEQARWCVNNGYVIPKSEIQAGDLVFWQRYDCNCGRYDEIHHVGIYLGDGRVVEASSSRGQVVVNDLWGEEEDGDNWQLAFFARPA